MAFKQEKESSLGPARRDRLGEIAIWVPRLQVGTQASKVLITEAPRHQPDSIHMGYETHPVPIAADSHRMDTTMRQGHADTPDAQYQERQDCERRLRTVYQLRRSLPTYDRKLLETPLHERLQETTAKIKYWLKHTEKLIFRLAREQQQRELKGIRLGIRDYFPVRVRAKENQVPNT